MDRTGAAGRGGLGRRARELDTGAAAARDWLAAWLGHPTRAKAFAAVLFATALYAWRSGDGIAHPQLYAEDGRVFLSEAQTYGLVSVLVPYAGYLHVVPRLVALVSSLFPAAHAPDLYVAATVLIVAATAAAVATAGHRHAWLLAGTMMLVPVGGEIFGTLTNAQWFAQVGLVVVTLTASPRSRAVRLGQLLFVLAFAVTGPYAIFAAPLAAWRLWRRSDPHSRAIAAIVIAGALVQAGFVLREPSPYEGVHDPWHLARLLLDRWIGQSAHRGLTARPAAVRADLLLAIMLVATLSEPLARGLLAYAALALGAVFVRFVPDSHYFDVVPFGERYFYLPRLALLWCFLLLLVRLRRSAVFGLVGLGLMASGFDRWTRVPLPVLPWRDEASKIDEGRAVSILINPSRPGDRDPYPWMVIVPGRP